ncbi:hypothetical protein GC105_03500 [Alkalibaculum sp. M08DMB]|uniref:Uncharacterized protein n=1 Tax=Alkalibaculum sporogenes TaxID=2655001 RepID=A0A6A7K657_9FIRM|nr:hypothetical protein [Alkalibaculum sporogenes]MPW24855.1 hypothetical protein [Alkalibaculum sporogenes]
METFQVEEIEGFLNKIISVLNSRVVINNENQIIEVHILANNRRSAKQIIRDIQSALIAKFNLRIDHKIISIAQVYEEEENFNAPRLVIKSVEYTSYHMSGKAKVLLEYDGNLYIGESEGVHSSTQANRLVGQATIKAVEFFLNNAMRFIVEEIRILDFVNKQVVISGIYLVDKNTEKLLIGKCVVENDTNSAITKAVLDAVNRVLEVN